MYMALVGYRYAEEITQHFREQDIPVRVFDLAQAIDLPIDRHRFTSSNICGFAARYGDLYMIAVNSSHPVTRQRFTAAHELGHCLCHLERGEVRGFFSCTGDLLVSESLFERQANAFASELLMPRVLVKRIIRAGCHRISSLADAFKVSKEAMHWRLSTLRIRHDMVLDRIIDPSKIKAYRQASSL
jgi:Zn-dependent peptidase ImmA (M78 family)